MSVFVLPEISRRATQETNAIIHYGTIALFKSKDLNPGQEAIFKRTRIDSNIDITHYDSIIGGIRLHAQDVDNFEFEIDCPHPDPLSETIKEAEYCAEVVRQYSEYSFSPQQYEEAVHDSYKFYQSRVGYFV
jgi:hypothetical protein